MTIKLLWLPTRELYDLRVFAGVDTDDRRYSGQLQLAPAAAAELRGLILAGDAQLGGNIVSEAGWVEPPASR